MKPKKSLFSRSGHAAAFVTAVTFCVTGHSFAADYDWNAAAGNFNNASNWNIAGSPAALAPGIADTANVANGGNAQWTTNEPKTILALNPGNGAAGTMSISGLNAFNATNGALVGRQSGAAVGTLNISGAGTIFNVGTGGTTRVGTVDHTFGTAGAGATGVLNITSGAVFNHNPSGDESFIIGNNLPIGTNPVQAGTYKGTLNVDGGTLNVLNGSRLYVGQSAGSVGEMNVSNGANITVADDYLIIGRGGQGTLNFSGGTITKNGGGTFAAGDLGGNSTVSHTGGTLNVAGGEFWVGQGVGTTGIYTLGAGAIINTNFWTTVGRGGGNGTLNLDGGTITKRGSGQFMVGSHDGGPSVGLLNHNSGTIDIIDGQLWIGQNGYATGTKASGTYNLNGGTINVNSWIAVGREGGNAVLNVAGGTLNKTGDGGFHTVVGQGNSTNTGKMTVSAGLANLQTGELWVGEDSSGEVALSGGELRVGAVQIGQKAVGVGLLQLDTGGKLLTGRIYGGPGTATVNFNGGTVQATANQAAFLDNIDTATIQTGGAVINTGTFNVGSVSGQVIGGTGGLTKQGTGTLSLLGANTYEGTTTISAGKLVTTTASLASGAITVAPTASLGLNLTALDQQLKPSGLTIDQSTLDFNLGSFYDTTRAPLDVVGNVTLTGAAGANTVNIDASLNSFWAPTVGNPIPLIGYDNATAASVNFASLKLGTLPLGMTATLTHNTGAKTIDLNITRLAILSWIGVESNVWNTSAINWNNQLGSGFTSYANGDPVLFNDDGESTSLDVQLPGTVTPGAYVTFANESKNYSLAGAGKISGTTRLLKQGAGTVTFSTANHDYTGGVRIEKGSVIINTLSNGGAASPIGAAPAAASNLVLAGGVLSYTGATATTNRGFTIGAVDGGIGVTNAANTLTISGPLATTAGGLVKKGAGTLALTGSGAIGTGGAVRVEAGKLVLNGTGTTPAQVVTAGEVWVGSTPDAPATMDIISSTLTTNNWLAVGRGNGAPEGSGPHTSTLNISGGSIVSVVNISTGYANGSANNTAIQNINIASSTLNNTGATQLGENRGATTNITATGNSVLNTREVRAGMAGGVPAGATAVNLTLENTATWNVGTQASISFASIGFDGGTGSLTVKDDAKFITYDDFSLAEAGTSTGNMTIQNNGAVTVRTARLGRGGAGTALVNQTGGTFSNTGDFEFQIGENGAATYNLSGGTVTSGGRTGVGRFGSSVASLKVSGGSFNVTNAERLFHVGDEGNGTLEVSAAGSVVVAGGFRVGQAATGVGTFSQTGGTVNIGRNAIFGENGKATVNLSGGQFSMNTNGTFNFVVGNFGTAQATLNVSNSADVRLMNNASLRIGNESTSASNTVNQTGGTITMYSNNGTTVGGTGIVVIGRLTASGLNTYNLAGGTLTTGAVNGASTSPSAVSVLKLAGGTLKASGNSDIFIHALSQVSVEGSGAKIDTNTFNVTATSPLLGVGTAGLTKTGAGTLTLAGANSYVGDTTISAGGVTLAPTGQLRFLLGANGVNNRVTGTGTAAFNGGFVIADTPASIGNGNSWTLVAGPVNETYGATFTVGLSKSGSTLPFTKSGTNWTLVDGGNTWTYSETNGVLTLTTGGVVDPYTTWTNTYFPGVTDPAIIGRDADPDRDGSSNALEFALGGAPNSGSDNAKVYNIQADSSDSGTEKELLLTIAVRAGTPVFSTGTSPTATHDGVTYTIQGSLDLTGFTTGVTAVDVVEPAPPATLPAGYEYRTFSLNGSNNLSGKGFLRVKVN